MRAFEFSTDIFQPNLSTDFFQQIFCISSNQLAHNAADSLVYLWVYFSLVDYWRHFLVPIPSAYILISWSNYFNLFIIIKYIMSRFLNMFSLLYVFLQMLSVFVASKILLRIFLLKLANISAISKYKIHISEPYVKTSLINVSNILIFFLHFGVLIEFLKEEGPLII